LASVKSETDFFRLLSNPPDPWNDLRGSTFRGHQILRMETYPGMADQDYKAMSLPIDAESARVKMARYLDLRH
jgi:hypothetical protein